jgi:Arc/MetJ-type ribon-helix-helix transcriptional regulator
VRGYVETPGRPDYCLPLCAGRKEHGKQIEATADTTARGSIQATPALSEDVTVLRRLNVAAEISAPRRACAPCRGRGMVGAWPARQGEEVQRIARRMTFGHTSGMTKQIAVKLPDDLVDELDRLVQLGTFDSRSQAIRTGIEAMVARQHRQEIDQRFRDGAARLPETIEDIDEATALAISSIQEEPWERWW